MRADLLGATASVDWAIAQLPAFQARLESWLDDNIEIAVVDTEPPATHDPVVAREKAELPLALSVEAGAYINAVRSALDMLACSIGKREMVLDFDDLYFPMADSLEQFTAGDYRGFKLVKQLSADSRLVFEGLKPYKGGNDSLWACHKLDITRKHKRLLQIYIRPTSWWVQGYGLREAWEPIATGYIEGAPGETVLGLLLKGAQRPKVKFSSRICLHEPSGAIAGESVTDAIRRFGVEALRAITAFD